MSVSVILVAAGQGTRFGGGKGRPKQFLALRRRPLLYWPVAAFEKTPSVGRSVIVTAAGRLAWARRFLRRYRFKKVSGVTAGGATRAESVRNGLAALPAGDGVVLIHDAARPLVTRAVTERVIDAVKRTGVALAGWPVPDTLKRARSRPGADRRHRRRIHAKAFVRDTIPRRDMWLAQTPQGFKRSIAERVMRRGASLTDDVQAAAAAGYKVELVPGDPRNLKVTVPADLALCEALLKS